MAIAAGVVFTAMLVVAAIGDLRARRIPNKLVAILAIGAMTPKPVVRDNEIVIRQIMRVTMSCDHRIIDGATGAKFLQTFKKILENPLYLVV